MPSGASSRSLLGGNVLITGASGGIGAAIVRAFAEHGASLTLSGRRAEILESLARELNATTARCDLADRSQVDALAERAADTDVLVANAGIPASGHILELTQAQIDTMLEVNLRAPIALARSLLPGMVERGRGHLVFISSLSGKAATPVTSLYSASKFGVRGFSLAVRQDLRGSGVSSSVVLPGFISGAGMFAEADVRLPRGVGTKSPEDVAAAVIQAVQRDLAEVSVAPVGLRLGAALAAVAPGVAETVARGVGSDEISRQLAAKQADKRP